MSVSDEILKRSGDVYRRLRNTARFLLGNLDGFDPVAHLQPLESMVAIDRWIVHRAFELQQKLEAAYARYDFAEIVQSLANFCSVDLGSLYLDVTKDRLYTMPEDSAGRRSAQTAMYHLTEAFARWIAPILSFTADEMWQFLPAAPAAGPRAENVLLATWYEGLAPLPAHAPLGVAQFDTLLALRERVSRQLEPMRAAGEIGAALEAEIALAVPEDQLAWMRALEDELRFLFITGDVSLQAGDAIDARRTDKPKCARCWHYRAAVGAVPAHPSICARCAGNVDGDAEIRRWF
jgi:isoleucyl-tRNA synthetase